MPNDQDIIQRMKQAIYNLNVTACAAALYPCDMNQSFVDARQADLDAIITELAAALAAKETTT